MTTVIATPDAIVADSFCAGAPSFRTDKIRHITAKNSGEQYLIGGAGHLDEVNYMINVIEHYGLDKVWLLHLKDHWPPAIMKKADSHLLVVDEQRQIWIVDSTMVPAKVHESRIAIGTGSEFAMAAMDHGCDLIAALEYAAKKDLYTKAPFDLVEFEST